MSLEVKQSTIKGAGRGVFATRKFKRGQLVASYDYDEVFPKSTVLTKEQQTYALNDLNMVYIGRREPRTPNGVAQLFNDASTFNTPDGAIGSISAIDPILIADYLARSYSGANVYCYHGRLFFASRDIEEGEELFYSYGIHYWCAGTMPAFDLLFKKIANETIAEWTSHTKVPLDHNILGKVVYLKMARYFLSLCQRSPLQAELLIIGFIGSDWWADLCWIKP